MAKISGKLTDGASQIIADAVIELRSLKNTNTVLNKVVSTTTTKEGFYSIDAQVGKYEVVIVRPGFSPASVGIIDIYADSLDGSLNDYLLNPNENEITPEILAQVTALRDDSKKFAATAEDVAKSIQDVKIGVDDTAIDVKQVAQQVNDALTLTLKAKGETDVNSGLAIDSAKTAQLVAQDITDQISTVKQLAVEVETAVQTASEAEENANLSALNAKNSKDEAAKFAQQAEQSASNVDLSNTLKLTGGTLTGNLFINDKKVLVDGDVNQFNGGIITGDTNFTGKLQTSNIDVVNSINIGKAAISNNDNNLFINDKKVLVDGDVNQFNGGIITGDTNFTGKLQTSNIDVVNSINIGKAAISNNDNNLFINDKKVLVDGDISVSQFNGGTVTGDTNFTAKLQQGGNDILTQGMGGLYSSSPLLEVGTPLVSTHVICANQSFTLAGNYQYTPDDSKVWSGILRVERRLYDVNGVVLTLYQDNTTYQRFGGYRNSGSGWQWEWESWKEVITTSNISNYQYGVGINQRWYDVTASRSLNTTYTNTTGTPIFLSVASNDYGAGKRVVILNVWVNDVPVTKYGSGFNSNGSYVSASLDIIIPVGETYKVASASNNIASWFELR
ncbi:prophage tail fiber N-terminal domain-containing protein [Orbus sturtevantii]|uniref:prophage tail fiber N-terminal domain-containing protein n=1 Tax=Orbus sturtevantii TaxID=3074109 RepID=UPI00370D53C4